MQHPAVVSVLEDPGVDIFEIGFFGDHNAVAYTTMKDYILARL